MTGSPTAPATPAATGSLPRWESVLAVVAHPDDESFGLGALLDGFVQAGARVSVLCLTQGEASTLGAPGPDLRHLRAMELQSAAGRLGVASAVLLAYPDGVLAQVDPVTLAAEVLSEVDARPVQGILVFDPTGVSGHPDHTAASKAALDAATQRHLPVLGWTLPQSAAEELNAEFGATFVGHGNDDVDLIVPVDRERQRMASLAHASQAAPTSVLWRRLDLLGDVEYLRWLRREGSLAPAPAAPRATVPREPLAVTDAQMLHVSWQSEDRFDIQIRGHTITVDQPTEVGGDDVGPTPTELFVAGLASCVGFYARRYLRRHHLDPAGLEVITRYRMGSKPARVGAVEMEIHLPAGLPPDRRAGLLAQAAHCTVHTSITHAPDIAITLASTG